ncbi:ABC transporter transmembrane domain-containing protein [Cohnella sp. AR92]|uniref:ABC transporter transmembrane domain-containing protein n=1 Tax=Cohnella sp. AR92 TaxID=648716 RepID=UPI000F8DC4EF|nr:ABC transporter transmembrane domain-containing protein [Cohnella sp. AR92]RUS45139.1 ATP-binding cassette domain-containing protein [Cohnella sp. AR92]
MSFIREMFRLAAPYKLLCGVFLAGVLIEAGYIVAAPLSLKYLVDDAFLERNAHFFVLILAALFGAGILNVCGNLAGDYAIGRLSAGIVRKLRTDLYAHLQRLPFSFYQRYRVGDLMARFADDMHSVERSVRTLSPFFLRELFSVCIGLALLFSLEWKLTFAVLAASTLMFLSPRLLQKRAENANRANKEAQERFANLIDETLKGHKTIKGLHQERRFQDKAREQIHDLFLKGVRLQGVNVLMERVPLIVLLLLNGIMLGYGGYLIFQDELSVGGFMAFFTLFLSVGQSATNLSTILPAIIDSGISYRRIRELFDEPAPESIDSPKPMPEIVERIGLNGVSFGYETSSLQLRGVTVAIPGGTYAAFVGPSGSGKSTALQLLARFYRPHEGSVSLNELDLLRIDEASFRKATALVSQDSFFFHGTVRDNLALDRTDLSEEEMEEAAKQANIHEVIAGWPDGYDTAIHGNGASLSGGERQRLSIARALLRRPKLLLLDEITAALDPASEAEINGLVQRLRPGRTIVSVTHRLDSVVLADSIHVFDKGRIVESGTHEELLMLGGLYGKLWEKQHGFRLSEDGLHAEVEAERLSRFSFFEGIDTALLNHLAGLFATEVFEPGDIVVREGDEGNKFYIIVRGQVEVLKRSADGENARVAVLQDGDHFGEIALLRGIPRTATVRAMGRSVLLSARREAFRELVDGYPQVLASLERTLEQRM